MTAAENILAVIPARGGSKGVPRKNLRRIGGRSLLARAIGAARDSGAVGTVLVSTDDAEIRGEALAEGAAVPFLRAAELSDDTARAEDVLRDAILRHGEAAGGLARTVVLLEPTSPFRTARHVADALALFRSGRFRSVVSVCPLERKPENIFRKGPPLEPYIRDPQEHFATRQDMAGLCRINSAIWVVDVEDFLREGHLLLPLIGSIGMTAEESINIDSELDLLLAGLVAERDGR